MKFKTTKKNMKDNYDKIISIGYCNAQQLLRYENEIAYSTRAEGWACDYYDVDGVLISTGYAPLTEKNAKKNYDLMSEYNNKAEVINYNYSIGYEEQKAQVKALLSKFVEEMTA
jgi:hypothetical protein